MTRVKWENTLLKLKHNSKLKRTQSIQSIFQLLCFITYGETLCLFYVEYLGKLRKANFWEEKP